MSPVILVVVAVVIVLLVMLVGLRKSGPKTEILLEDLRSLNHGRRLRAAWALLTLVERAAPFLREALPSEPPGWSKRAMEMLLENAGMPADFSRWVKMHQEIDALVVPGPGEEVQEAETFPALVRKLEHESPLVACEAAKALGQTKDPRAVEPLLRALRHHGRSVRWEAALAVRELGLVAAEALRQTLQSEPPGWARGVIETLLAIAEAPADDSAGRERVEAAMTLGDKEMEDVYRTMTRYS